MFKFTEKPYAHQEPIITIKLSENIENVTASDGSQQSQILEMVFEMNYETGHWRRLKRTRVVSNKVDQDNFKILDLKNPNLTVGTVSTEYGFIL